MTRFFALLLVVEALAMNLGLAAAAEFPSKPIRFITAEAGGSGDTAARIIARTLSRSLGQQVLIENRGGIGVVPAQAVAQSPPDGYTLLLYGSSVWLLPMLQDNVPFDPVKDFAPVTLATRTPMVVVVNPALPVKSIKELIALAKARPGELNYGSAGIGGTNHLAPELFKSMAHVTIVHVLYKGVATALNDLLAGRLQVMFPAIASGMPHVRSGRLRGLAVSTAQPTPLAPGLPTVAAAGLPGYEAALLAAALAPAKTPPAIVNRLNQEIARAVNEPEVKEKLFEIGIDSVGSSPEELAQVMTAEVAKWGKLIKDAGIRSH
jgi:tripartite-type tricarboxylate transporter receptor subunit TctC